jgi:hypothetical protein
VIRIDSRLLHRSRHRATKLTCCLSIASFALFGSARADTVRDSSATPDRSLLLAMREPLAKTPPVRISGSFPRLDCRGVTVDESGLHYDDAFRFGAGPASLPASPIPWSRIERVEVAKTGLARGALVGAAIGLALGFVWNSYDPAKSQSALLRWGPTASGTTMGRMVFATAMGTAIGAGVGYSRREWQTIYPAETDSEKR